MDAGPDQTSVGLSTVLDISEPKLKAVIVYKTIPTTQMLYLFF